MIIAAGVISKLLPSLAARLSSSTARRPPAPGLFSTSVTFAKLPRSLSATRRATTSTVPPAGKPVRMRVVSSICAWVIQGQPASEPVTAAIRCLRFIMALSPWVGVAGFDVVRFHCTGGGKVLTSSPITNDIRSWPTPRDLSSACIYSY